VILQKISKMTLKFFHADSGIALEDDFVNLISYDYSKIKFLYYQAIFRIL